MEAQKADITITFRNSTETVFIDAIGYQLGSGFLGVMMGDGKTYIYPSDLIQAVVHVSKE